MNRFRSLPVPTVTLFAALAMAPSLLAQCPSTASMVVAYRASGPITLGQQQNPASGWTYERSGPSGTERLKLEGLTSPTWSGGAWGTPNQAFYVPLAGPVYSNIPAHNEMLSYYRDPSFEGIMLHPNFGVETARIVLSPQTPLTLTGLTVRAEHLGGSSRNAAISARIERTGGAIVPLIPVTSLDGVAPAQTLTSAGPFPTLLAVGDRVVIETSSGSGGDASEDWVNVNAIAELAGAPLIEVQPLVRANCDGPTTARVIAAGASSYRWRKDGVPLTDGPTVFGSTIAGADSATLSITQFAPGDVGIYTCLVSNSCGQVLSTGATITLCFADFNCDGFLDFFDYDAFVAAFETGDTRADYNRDGFLDFFDYDDFVTAFETGC